MLCLNGEGSKGSRVNVKREERCLALGDITSDGASLEHISIWASSDRCSFFSARGVSAEDRPIWG